MASSISFVIPTLNEEEAILPTLDTIPVDELEDDGYSIEVLIIDGESTDRTRELAEDWGADVIVEPRPGYGRAYKTGFANATGDLIVTGDADGTYPFELTPDLVSLIVDDGLDFVTTDRFAEMEPGAMSPKHRLGNWVLTTGCKVLFGATFDDSQSGMWVFRRRILDEIELTDDGMPFSEEIKIEAFRHDDLDAVEVGIPYRERIGEVKLDSWRDGLKNLTFLFKKRLGITRATE